MDKNIQEYKYKFNFRNGDYKEFTIKLNKTDLILISSKDDYLPPWTKLDFQQCTNCPLDINEHPYCPIAKNLVSLLYCFHNYRSFEEATISCETKERTYSKTTSIQEGLSSMIGIYMVASGCPIMNKLKPMVNFHLPFSSLEETCFRVLSTYLLAQYFLAKQNKKPDWELNNLLSTYEEIKILNKCMIRRIKSISNKDANINAIVILDCFASFIPLSINDNQLEEFESLFKPYF
jgi:hypothetical protein